MAEIDGIADAGAISPGGFSPSNFTGTLIDSSLLAGVLETLAIPANSGLGAALTSVMATEGIKINDRSLQTFAADEASWTTFFENYSSVEQSFVTLINDDVERTSEDYLSASAALGSDQAAIVGSHLYAKGEITANQLGWVFHGVVPRLEKEPAIVAHLSAENKSPLTLAQIQGSGPLVPETSADYQPPMSLSDQASYYGTTVATILDFAASAAAMRKLLPGNKDFNVDFIKAEADKIASKHPPRRPADWSAATKSQLQACHTNAPKTPAGMRLSLEGIQPGNIAFGWIYGDEKLAQEVSERKLTIENMEAGIDRTLNGGKTVTFINENTVDSVNKRLLELGLDSLVLPTDATTGDMLTKAGIAICEAVRTAKEHDRETHDEFCYDPAFLAAIERLNETADVGFVIPDEDDPKRHHHEEVVEAAVEEDDTKEEPPVADALPLEVLDEMTKVLSGTVSDLQAYLDSGEALHLEALLQMEEDGKNRSTALTAIKVAIDELG